MPRRRASRAVACSVVSLLSILFVGLFVGELTAAEPAADLVLLEGRIYTLDAARSWAEALAVRGGRIVYVGPDAGAARFVGAETRVLRLGGKMVLPGFHDSHVHLVSGGVELAQCDLNGIENQEELFARIRACAAGRDPDAWVVGGGWALPLFPDGNPAKEQLDALVGNRPAYLSAADGHSAWVSSRALALAGIGRKTPDPAQGRIERSASGEPSGTLREAASHLMDGVLPKITPDDRLAGLRRSLALAHSFGITSAIEASASSKVLETYATLDRSGELQMRVLVSLRADPAVGEAQVPELLQLRDSARGLRRVRATAVKMFADGVIEARTAALLAPYLGKPGPLGAESRGELNWEPETFARMATRLDREGFQVHIHAIGDRAIRESLNALAAAQRANGTRDARHHVAHIQLFDPADIPRFRELGVAANFQPLWAWADPYIVDLTEPVLGPERSRWLYPIRSLAASGATVVAGSDWSVSSLNPLQAIEVALTRRNPASAAGPAWNPQETVDLPTMLAAYTIAGARLAFEERETGSLEVGKAADLIVLDRDLFAIPPHEIGEAKVLRTWIDGREVFRAAGSS